MQPAALEFRVTSLMSSLYHSISISSPTICWKSGCFEPADREGALLLENYIEAFRAAAGSLNANAILPLIDVTYYPCNGDEACVGKRISSLIGDAETTPLASCLYSMPGSCSPAEITPGSPLLNDASVAMQVSPEEAAQERTAFICKRYHDCSTRN